MKYRERANATALNGILAGMDPKLACQAAALAHPHLDYSVTQCTREHRLLARAAEIYEREEGNGLSFVNRRYAIGLLAERFEDLLYQRRESSPGFAETEDAISALWDEAAVEVERETGFTTNMRLAIRGLVMDAPLEREDVEEILAKLDPRFAKEWKAELQGEKEAAWQVWQQHPLIQDDPETFDRRFFDRLYPKFRKLYAKTRGHSWRETQAQAQNGPINDWDRKCCDTVIRKILAKELRITVVTRAA